MVIHAVRVHELVIAHQHHMLVDHGRHAMARLFANVMDAFLVDRAGICFLDRQRDGMVRIGFRVRRVAQQVIGVDVVFGMHRHHVEGAVGQRAGLVEHHGVHLGKRLKIVAALDQHAKLAGAADAAEERQRHADDERARAADHQEGEAAQNPVAPGAHAQKRRDDGKQQGKPRDGGGVVAGEAGDEVLCASLLLRGVFHQLKDAADG